MIGIEIAGPFVAATVMSVGALCVFIWAVMSGVFNNVDDASTRFYLTETESEKDGDDTAR